MTPPRLDEADTHSFTCELPATSLPPARATSRLRTVAAIGGWVVVGAVVAVLLLSGLLAVGSLAVMVMVLAAGYVPVPVTAAALVALIGAPLVCVWVGDRR